MIFTVSHLSSLHSLLYSTSFPGHEGGDILGVVLTLISSPSYLISSYGLFPFFFGPYDPIHGGIVASNIQSESESHFT